MRENDKQLLDKKSYDKAKRVRTLVRHEMFEKNRASSKNLTYLEYYDSQTRQILLDSLKVPIPDPLPPPSLFTISLYRRACKAAFLTQMIQGDGNNKQLDPHLTYESLWILAGVEDL